MNPQPTKVSGQKDPVMACLRDLATEDGRGSRNLFFAEGEEIVLRAFDYGARVKMVLLSEGFAGSEAAGQLIARAAARGAGIYSATEGLLAKTLGAKPTPECLAILERGVVSLAEAFAGDFPLALMVEHGENPDNLGMLLRSTDAAGVSGVVLAAETVDPFGRRVVRGSRGAVFTVPIAIRRDPARVIEEAKRQGLQVVATSANAETPYTTLDYAGPTLIVVGNEHVGISETVRGLADHVVAIPMRGRINSLNIAIAASVVLYEAIRQRTKDVSGFQGDQA